MIGQTLAHYELESRLGEGGSGVVYRARDLRLDRFVAVKILADALRDDELAWARLLREARLASQLNHPNIAAIYDLGEEDDQAYIVMEYVEGLTLADLIPDGGMPIEQVQRYAAQIRDALAFAHEHGTLHGDLKGSNIIVSPEGTVKLLDFGLGRRIPRKGNTEVSSTNLALTESGAIAGTLPYLAPEVLRGDVTSVQSDVWSLGVLLYQMATSDFHCPGTNLLEISVQVLTGTPDLSKAPAALRPALQGSLEKDLAARFPTVRELSLALKEALDSGDREGKDNSAALPNPGQRTLKFFQDHRWWIAGGAAALGILMAAGIAIHHAQSAAHTTPIAPAVATINQPDSARVENPEATVWVNTDSGIYHCSGTRWYGKTHVGEYMKQKQARAKNYRPAGDHACF
jgi:eukaryotic-like serine/threonine-protein kinase